LIITQKDLVQIHSGALAEQFVGQEFLAYADFFREEKLFFWEREKQTSSAEVDYIITIGQHIIPVEVKAGAHGHLKSLMQFMQEKKSKLGIRISQRPLSYTNGVLSIPFYMISQIPRLTKEFLS
jgi:predicted AAA+ superfamily ATPase